MLSLKLSYTFFALFFPLISRAPLAGSTAYCVYMCVSAYLKQSCILHMARQSAQAAHSTHTGPRRKEEKKDAGQGVSCEREKERKGKRGVRFNF